MSAKKNLFRQISIAAVVLGLVAISSILIIGQPAHKRHVGLVEDWSSRHVIYTNPGTYDQVKNNPAAYSRWLRTQYDTRFIFQQIMRNRTSTSGFAPRGAMEPTSLARRIAGPGIGPPPLRPIRNPFSPLKADWAIPLGAGGVAQGMSPAKYGFDVNGTPNCTADFAAFPINATTQATRAHVVGTFSTSGSSTGTVAITVTPTGGSPVPLTLTAVTTASSGLNFQIFTTGSSANATTEATNLAAAINRNLSATVLGRVVAVASGATVTVYTLTPGTRAVLSSPSDTGVSNLSWAAVTAGTDGTHANIVGLNQLYSGSGSPMCAGLTFPEFTFSYASGVGGVDTSPTISTDGTKIAYVENDTNIGAILHVLTIGSGTEHDASCINSGTASPTCATAAVIPGSTAGSTASDFMLPLGLVARATAGVADTNSPPFVNYSSDIAYVGDDTGHLYSIGTVFGGTPAFSGGSWPVTVSANKLTAPVVDVSNTGNIFVGDSGGFLYNYSSGGTKEATLTIGGSTAPAITDGPIVDSTNGVGYVAPICNASSASSLTQFAFTSTTLTARAAITLPSGNCSDEVTYSPALDNNYFTKGISSATAANNGELVIYYSTTNNSYVNMYHFISGALTTTGALATNLSIGGAVLASPITEFDNINGVFVPTQLTSTTTTVTMTTPTHAVAAGDTVTIAGVAAGSGDCSAGNVANINGTHTVATVPTTTTFTFAATITAGITGGSCGLGSATVTSDTDFLFFGTTVPEVFTYTLPLIDLTPTATNTASVAGGTSAIIVDNNSTAGQAASLYYGTLLGSICGSGACAVKLTQAALQ